MADGDSPELIGGVPAELAHLAWLLGTWYGVGLGQYPTIEDFRFGQEVRFTTDGRPFLSYRSQSWLLDDEGNRVKPLATETGYWRPQPDNRVEVVLAHPTGYAEIWHGQVVVKGLSDARITGAQLELHTDLVARTDSAKDYSAGQRLYGLVEGELLWTFDMAAMGHPLSNHVAARLQAVHGNGDSPR